MSALLRRLAARFGEWLLSLRKPVTGYGFYLVFRYGTEAQAQKYLDEALAARPQTKVLFVPVVTDKGGVPAPAPSNTPSGPLVN